jgi:hypothetical protein
MGCRSTADLLATRDSISVRLPTKKFTRPGTNGRLMAWAGMMRWSSRGHFERDYLEERYVAHGWLVVAAIVIFMFLWIVMAVSVYRGMPAA